MSSKLFSIRASPAKAFKNAVGRAKRTKQPHNPSLSLWAPTPSRSIVQFDILKILAHGREGTRVYLARDKATSREVALKVVPKMRPAATREDHFRALQMRYHEAATEQAIAESLSRPENDSFVPLLCSWHDSQNFYLAMEYMGGGDLAIELAKERRFGEERAKVYAAELIVAIEEMRKRGIVHRDIKPANVLLGSDGHLRLADFGLAAKYKVRQAEEDLESERCWLSFAVDANSECGRFAIPEQPPVWTSTLRCGTSHFMTPQQHTGSSYGTEVDEWSVGVTLFCMLSGRLPFGSDFTEKRGIAQCVIDEPLVFRDSDDLSAPAQSLLDGMLKKDPQERLSLAQVKAHPFFNSIDWEKIRSRDIPAPWRPYVPPSPRNPSQPCPIIPGMTYDDLVDPCPSFEFTSRRMEMKPVPAPPTNPPALKRFFHGRKAAGAKIKTKRLGPTPTLKSAPAIRNAPSSSTPPRGVRPIVIFPTPPPNAAAKLGPGLVSTMSPLTSPTPPRNPPGIFMPVTPTPLPKLAPDELLPRASESSSSSTSGDSSSSEDESTPNTTPLTKAFQDSTSIIWAAPSSSSSDCEYILDASFGVDQFIPQEMRLSPAEMPVPIPYKAEPKPRRITEAECMAMFMRPEEIVALFQPIPPAPEPVPVAVSVEAAMERKPQSRLRPLLLPEMVARRSQSGSSSSSSGSGSCPGYSSGSSSRSSSSSVSSSTARAPALSASVCSSYTATPCANQSVIEKEAATFPQIAVSCSPAPQFYEPEQGSKETVPSPPPSLGKRFKSWLGRVFCGFPSDADGERRP